MYLYICIYIIYLYNLCIYLDRQIHIAHTIYLSLGDKIKKSVK